MDRPEKYGVEDDPVDTHDGIRRMLITRMWYETEYLMQYSLSL